MKVKLKTEEQLIKEFGFKVLEDGFLKTFIKRKKWLITPRERKLLGTMVEVDFIKGTAEGVDNYTYETIIKGETFHWNENWFKPYEFIKKEEFDI